MRSWNRRRRRAARRCARRVMHDIPPILELINGYAAKGIMLPRTEFELSEAIRDFTVVTARRRVARLRRAAFLQPHDRRDPVAGGARARQDARRGPQSGGGAGGGGAGVRTGRRLRLHLRGGVLQQGRVSRRGARRFAAKGLEGLPALPQIPGLRRDRGAADPASGALAASRSRITCAGTIEFIQITHAHGA